MAAPPAQGRKTPTPEMDVWVNRVSGLGPQPGAAGNGGAEAPTAAPVQARATTPPPDGPDGDEADVLLDGVNRTAGQEAAAPPSGPAPPGPDPLLQLTGGPAPGGNGAEPGQIGPAGPPSRLPPTELAARLARDLNIPPAAYEGREEAAVRVMAGLQQLRSLPERERREFLRYVEAQGFGMDTALWKACQQIVANDAFGLRGEWTAGVAPEPPDADYNERLIKAVRAMGHQLGGAYEAAAEELLTPANIAIMSGFLLLFVAVQASPAGWVADALGGALLLGTALFVGLDVMWMWGEMERFLAKVAVREGDHSEEAGAILAGIVSHVTIEGFVALLLHSAGSRGRGTRVVPPAAGQTDVVTSGRGLVRMPSERAAQLRAGGDADAAGRTSGPTARVGAGEGEGTDPGGMRPRPEPEPGRYRACFLAGTLVDVDGLATPIEDAVAGSLVRTLEPECGGTNRHPITMLHRGRTRRVVRVEAGGGWLLATANHPFHVAGRGWVMAGRLRLGDLLTAPDGRYQAVSATRRIALELEMPTYNLAVKVASTYLVLLGGGWVLVHNADPFDSNRILYWLFGRKPSLRDTDLDGLSVWRTENEEQVRAFLEHRVNVNGRSPKDPHAFLTEQEVAAAGLRADLTPTGDALGRVLPHYSLRPQAAPFSRELSAEQFAALSASQRAAYEKWRGGATLEEAELGVLNEGLMEANHLRPEKMTELKGVVEKMPQPSARKPRDHTCG